MFRMDLDYLNELKGNIPKDKLVCKYCHKKYTIVQNLKRHVKFDHFGFRFCCGLCDIECPRKEEMIHHYVMFHMDNLRDCDNLVEVQKLTSDGQIRPLNRMPKLKRGLSKSRTQTRKLLAECKMYHHGQRMQTPRACSGFTKQTQSKNPAVFPGHPVVPKEINHSVDVTEDMNSETVETTQVVTNSTSDDDQPQQLYVAVDPVSQFRIERVIAERVNSITEKSVIETMDNEGKVTRRETIERQYHLKSS